MKHFIVLLSVFIYCNTLSQESFIRIYSSDTWQIENLFTQGTEGTQRNIYIRHVSNSSSTDPENGAVKKYSSFGNKWTIPAGGYLGTLCRQCVDPPMVWIECKPSPFIGISPADTNFIILYTLTLCAMCPDASTFITWSGAVEWRSYYNIFGCGGMMVFPNGGDFDPSNDSVCYYGYTNGLTNFVPAIYKTTNRGINWYQTCIIPDLRDSRPENYWYGELSGGFIRVCPMNTNHIFAVHRDYMMLSTDAGYNFNPLPVPPLKSMVFDTGGNMIYGLAGQVLFASDDQGLTWTSTETPQQFTSLEVNYDNNNILYAGSTAGLYRTTNRGISWHLYNNMFAPSKKVLGIVKQPDSGDTVIVCTSDAVYKVFRDQLTTSANSYTSLPVNFELNQNYPNPFNPETVIEFVCPEETHVTLIVYDAVGRKVAELLNGRVSAGRHSVVYNSATSGSGVYFCRLQAGEVTKSIVMILQK